MSEERANLLERISHNPLGLEHPYQSGPDERSPRQPLAGQPASLGLLTWPAGAAVRAWAEWWAGEETGRVEASWNGDQEGCSQWLAGLPGFRFGQEVRYRLAASDGRRELYTPQAGFQVMDWRSAGPARTACPRPDGLDVYFAAQGEVPASVYHLRLEQPGGLRLSLSHAENQAPQSAEKAGDLQQAIGGLQVSVCLDPYRLEVRRADGKLLLAKDRPPEWLLFPGQAPSVARLSFVSPPEEGFYGFGERFNALNQRGQRLDVCVYEQYKDQGVRTYLPVPFFLSSQGYGLWVDSARRVTFDLAGRHPEVWSLEAQLGPQAVLNLSLLAGDTPLDILHAAAARLGLPELPPEWAFGPWMSGNEWNSQAEVLRQVRLTGEHGIPASVLVIEAWSDEKTFYIWNDAQYTPRPGSESFSYTDFTFPPDGLWPNPKEMIDELHRQGIRLVLWQIPVMKKLEEPYPQHDLDEAYMLEQGYCLRHADGRPYRIRPFWFHDGLLWDPTHPEGVDWWLRKRAYLLDELGVDGFKTDGGEHLWGSDVVFANGLRADEGINLYPNLYVGAYYRFARQRRNNDALTFSRAGFSGAQAFPCHWAGDENSTWEAFRASIRAGLNAGLSGLPFWGWDIAGFSGEIPDAELYLRSAAMALFCPVMQYHSEHNNHRLPSRDRTPWNIAERTGQLEVIDIYRSFARLRMRLLPYICAEARHSAQTGEPLMRPLFLDWPEDPACWQIEDQYCFGRALLVAPVTAPAERERRLYLPAGEWEDFWSGERMAGGGWIRTLAPLERIPVFRRLDVNCPGLPLDPPAGS